MPLPLILSLLLFGGCLLLSPLLGWWLFKRLSSWSFSDRIIAALLPLSILVISQAALMKVLGAPAAYALGWPASRLTATFAMVRGYQLYYPPDRGPVLEALYGPGRAFAYLPATLTSSITIALLVAGSLSILYGFLPILWLHLHPYLNNRRKLLVSFFVFICFCGFTLTSPAINSSVFVVGPDAPMLGLSATACALIYHRKHQERTIPLVISAFLMVLAVWTKQTALPLLVALPFYVLCTEGYRSCLRYVAFIALFCALSLGVAFIVFDAKALIFNMYTIAVHSPWINTNKLKALGITSTELMTESLWFVPTLAFYIGITQPTDKHQEQLQDRFRSWLTTNRWSLFLIVALFMVSTSIVGRAKVGGALNTFSPTIYFLAVAVCLASIELTSREDIDRNVQKSVKLLITIITVLFLYIQFSPLSTVLTAIRELPNNPAAVAYSYAKKHPGIAYFPWNPLSSLMAEGKLYHFCYGLIDRRISGFPVSKAHIQAYLPPNIKFVAFPEGHGIEGTLVFTPEFTQQIVVDELPGWLVFARTTP